MMRLSLLGKMSNRDRRALTLGALALATIVAIVRGVPTLRAWSDASVASAREVVTEAARAHRGAMGAQSLSDSIRVRSERFVALAPAILDGSSAATAGATLASIVSGAAASSDTKLGSAQMRADTALHESSGAVARAFTRVAVRATLTADVRGLSRFLLALERGLTLLSIDELSITQPEPAADATRPEMLQVDLVVSGLALTTRRASR